MVNSTSDTWTPQGWTPSPNGRGSIDIIWACVVTISLCTWSILCVNVPAPNETLLETCLRKVKVAAICCLGPEFLLFLAIGQWQSAKRSFEDFRHLGYSQWTMKHAFLADMGGFVLETEDKVSMPLTVKQLHYLIVEGYICDDRVTTEVILDKTIIDDRNKTDAVVRVITVAQTLWFVINCIGRGIQHLAVTTLELTTLGFIATALAVSFFWAHKPADIKTAQVLRINATVADIRTRAGIVALDEWYRTPLEFLDPKQSYFGIFWVYNISILRRLHLVSAQRHRPITSIPDDNSPDITCQECFIAIPFTAIFWAINIAGWNFWFPTPIERNLWRIASFVLG